MLTQRDLLTAYFHGIHVGCKISGNRLNPLSFGDGSGWVMTAEIVAAMFEIPSIVAADAITRCVEEWGQDRDLGIADTEDFVPRLIDALLVLSPAE